MSASLYSSPVNEACSASVHRAAAALPIELSRSMNAPRVVPKSTIDGVGAHCGHSDWKANSAIMQDGSSRLASAVRFGETFYGPSSNLASLTRYAADAIAHRHRHDHPYVAVVLSGGFCQTGRCERFASTGEIVLLPAGSWHSDKVGPSGSTCLNLHLDHKQAESLEGISARLDHRGCAVAREIASEITRDQFVDSFTLDGLIQDFLAGVRTATPRPVDSTRVGALVEWIANEPLRQWRLSDAAQMVGLHPTHLARAFRQWTGQSIGAFRRTHLMVQLSMTLCSTDDRLADIASEFGFSDQAHMSRAFKRHTGLAPGKYWRAFRR
jgi:AraC family transcriptional regulator